MVLTAVQYNHLVVSDIVMAAIYKLEHYTEKDIQYIHTKPTEN